MTIGTKMGLGFGTLLALMATLAIVVLVQLAGIHRQFSSVIRHDAPVIATARHLQGQVVDMETGQRGFVITGADEFLEPYDSAVASFADLLDEERALVGNNPSQRELLDKIEASVQEWRTVAAEPEIAMRRKINKAKVDARHLQETLSQGVGKRLMDRFMSLGHEIETSFREQGDWEGAFAVEIIEKGMTAREAGQRGFLITGQEEFLEKYHAGEQKDLLKNFADLRAVISDRGRGRALSEAVDQLERLAADWHREAAESEIQARRVMNENAETLRDVAALLERGTGKRIPDRIRADFRKFIDEEETLAAARFENASGASRTTTATTILLAVASVIFGGIMALKITRGITRPVHQLARALESVAQNDLSQKIEVRSKDEIGALSTAFNRMVCDLRRLKTHHESDIADLKRVEADLRRAELRSRTLLDGSPTCNKIIDLDSRLQYMSAAGVNGLKIPDIDAFYGCTYPPPFFPETTRTLLTEHLDRAIAGETCRVEVPAFDMEGTEVWFDTTFVPVINDEGGVEYVIGASVNITERKRAEEEVRAARLALEARVDERTAELRSANAALELEIVQRRQLEREVLNIATDEQRRIAEDLHDGLGQELTALAFLGKNLEKKLIADASPAAADGIEVLNLVRKAGWQLRTIVKGIYPTDLDAESFAIALEQLASSVEARFGVNCSSTCTAAPSELETGDWTQLYRIACEAVANAARHAKAQRVSISLDARDGKLVLEIRDDGAGFSVTDVREDGLGLRMMRYRAGVIGSSFSIDSHVGNGTTVRCVLEEEAKDGKWRNRCHNASS